MEKWFVAPSYAKNSTQIGKAYEENGKMYIKIKMPCPRCGATGHYSYNQIDGTRCYGCMGSKFVTKKVRAYTEKECTRMQAANERARAKKEAEKEAKARDLVENAAKYKHEVALKLGFGENEKAYLVYGDDTFAIKDQLKKLGARFDPTLKWFFAEEVTLPEGYKLCEMSFDELYNYNINTKWAEFKEDAKAIVSRRINTLKGPSTSEYYPGAEKERIRNITAKVASIRGFEGMYGYTSVYTFTSGNYVFVWMTAKCDLDLTAGETVDLTGTIKKFDEYMGIKTTYLTRCIVKKIEK